MEEKNKVLLKREPIKTRDLCEIALFSALIAVCSWISIPSSVPFTMQTFGVFLATLYLRGQKGTYAVMVYLVLGAVGAPVFANFTSGLGTLLGMTGGYLIGFLAMTLFFWLFSSIMKENKVYYFLLLALGQIICYTFGTIWFTQVYAQNIGEISFISSLMICVIPYILPDLCKLSLAFMIYDRISKVKRIQNVSK